MKTLLLMRHAKSSWKKEGQADHDRPLNDRGKRDAPRMGNWLKEQGIVPDTILTSSAKRARRTAEAMAEALGRQERLIVHEELYSAHMGDYVELLRDLPDSAETALLVGHDPTISEFVSALAKATTEMPTAAIACFDLSVGAWKDFDPFTGCELRAHWQPRELPE